MGAERHRGTNGIKPITKSSIDIQIGSSGRSVFEGRGQPKLDPPKAGNSDEGRLAGEMSNQSRIRFLLKAIRGPEADFL